MTRLTGKTVLITGATSGIGEATARLFAEHGSHLVLTGRRAERLKALQTDLTAKFKIQVSIYAFDVTDYNACVNFVDSLKTDVDVLINNAGLALGVDPVFAFEQDDLNAMVDTNVRALLTLTRLISPKMKKRNTGHIINIGSTAGHAAYAGGAIYCATKHAVKAITEATKMDLHGTKIRVSMVSPGLVDTEFSTVRFKGNVEKADSVYKGLEPLTALDIAEIIVFIANRPTHVNIMDAIVYPVYQSSPTLVHRDE